MSFYTFQAISYLVDLRNQKLSRASWLDYAVFMSFWPKFVAGPIIRATAFMPQLQARRRLTWPNFYLGAESIIYGLFLKTALSDYLLPQVQKVYAAPAAYDGTNSLLAAFFYTFQIYGDFAGYSLVVIGLARILGYSVRPNFARPNFAVSFSDFWRRWHISLSTWLGTYVFRNLAPKRLMVAKAKGPRGQSDAPVRLTGSPLVKEAYISRNQLLTLLVSGLWHGAAWTFVSWGALHGLMLVFQRQIGRRIKALYQASRTMTAISIPLQMAGVFIIVAASRVLFRAQDLSDAMVVFHNILHGPYDWKRLDGKATLAVSFAIILGVMFVEALSEYGIWRRHLAHRRLIRTGCALGVLLLTLLIGDFAGGRFIYVRF